ncbi:PPA1309 family protein [Kineococcus gynurae]|uniref:PPA1309 family protein n=1 Tax=Kineococcus gynurae TaxID=452979 RepID=A0ABV5LNB8_9ACTN
MPDPIPANPAVTDHPAAPADHGAPVVSAPPAPGLWRAVAEIERHVAADGWGVQQPRLFAFIRTADALRRDPGLADRLPPAVLQEARADDDHLTAVEQEGLPSADGLDELLGRLAWPPGVDGAGLVVERLLVPPDAEAEVRAATASADEATRARALAEHPAAEDVRIAVGVLRRGGSECAVRSRSNDSDGEVRTGTDLVPGLISALTATLE